MPDRLHNRTANSRSRFEIDSYLAAALIAYVLMLLIYMFALPRSWQLEFDQYYGELILLSILVLLFSRSTFRAMEKNTRLFFGILTFGFGAWLTVPLFDFATRDWSSNSVELFKDILFLVYAATMAVAIELRLDTYNDPFWLQRRGLYAIGGLLLVFASYTYFAIVPVSASSKLYATPYSLYAAIDLYLVTRFLTAATVSRNESWKLVYGFGGVVFSLILLADILSVGYRQGYVSYAPGQWLNLAWYLWYAVAFFSSGIRLFNRTAQTHGTDSHLLTPATSGILIFGLAIPLIHTIGYGANLFDTEVRQAREIFVGIWIVAIAGLLYGLYIAIRRNVGKLDVDRISAIQEANKLEHQLERELRIRSLGRLSAGLAHDFGNTVSAIAMHARAIEIKSRKGTIADRDITGLTQAVKYAQDLVTKLSLFSGTEKSTSVESFDINEEIDKTVQVVRPSLGNGVFLNYRPAAERMLVNAERSIVHQVLTNYIYNAIDAVENHGRINVTTERVEIDIQCASCGDAVMGDFVALSVTDNGSGIHISLRDNVFEPLISTKPVGKGSGLGLSTVHGIMHRIGGHVDLVVSEKAGTCFKAYFPVSSGQ